mgnify:CR=1 FL=1
MPAGKISSKVSGVPKIGGEDVIDGMLNNGGDISDINGFNWEKTQVKMPDINNISVNWVGNAIDEFTRVNT